jgi:hypothetical protein
MTGLGHSMDELPVANGEQLPSGFAMNGGDQLTYR